MKTKKMRYRAVLLVAALGLFISAQALALPEIQIPGQYGTLKEVYHQENSPQDRGKTIVYIQDAHCNYEAQKNMAQILDYLAREYGLKLIMVEGGSGDVSLSFLRGYADGKARAEVAEKYLKDGKISGEEYLDILSDYPIELFGIEDEGLYDAHLVSFQKLDSFREEGLGDLEELSRIVDSLKLSIYNEELRQFEENKKGYEEKSLSLPEYCLYLKGTAEAKGLSLVEYPQMASFCAVSRLEKEMDFKEAETERNAFIQDLANLLDDGGVKELLARSQEFKEKKITTPEYYSFLEAKAEGKLNLKDDYPRLAAYLEYLKLSKDIDASSLTKEIVSLEEKIKDACLENPEQKRLSEIDKFVQVLIKTLNLELTPEDYAYFQAHKTEFNTASWIDFLTQNCTRYNLTTQPHVCWIIDENLGELERFYQLGTQREEAFIKNIADKMDASGQEMAVLITGGFHTPGLTRMLKEKGYSYVVAAPVITQKGDSGIYFSVLRNEKKVNEESINTDNSPETR